MKYRERIRRMRDRLFRRQKGRCFYCDELTVQTVGQGDIPPNAATIDHIVPQSKGGTYEAGNIVLACRTCNQAKGSLSGKDFLRARVAKSQETPPA